MLGTQVNNYQLFCSVSCGLCLDDLLYTLEPKSVSSRPRTIECFLLWKCICDDFNIKLITVSKKRKNKKKTSLETSIFNLKKPSQLLVCFHLELVNILLLTETNEIFSCRLISLSHPTQDCHDCQKLNSVFQVWAKILIIQEHQEGIV